MTDPNGTPTPSATPMADNTVDPSGNAPMSVPATPEPTTPVVENTPAATPPAEPQPQDFRTILPEDLRGHERLEGINSVEDLARKFAEAPVGPTVPDADKYTIPEGIPPEFGKIANKLGYTQEQLNGTIQIFANQMKQQADAQATALETAAQSKLTEWGEQKDTYIRSAKDAVNYWDKKVPGLKAMLDESGYGNHPLVLELFKAQGLELKEGGFLPSNPNTPQGKKSTANVLYPDQK